MRKNIKGIAAGSLGLLALQLPGMTVFAQAADRKARLANALQNTVLGMGTVFVMLIAIALIIYIGTSILSCQASMKRFEAVDIG